MVPGQRVEEVNPDALELVGADGCGDNIAGGVEIARDHGRGQGAHPQTRRADRLEHQPIVAVQRRGGVEGVLETAEPGQLHGGGGAVGRLVEGLTLKGQGLVGAKNQTTGTQA